jgi:predicted transcriptional regulator
MSESSSPSPLLKLTAQIVAAHAANNHVTTEALLRLIETVHSALAGSAPVTLSEAKQQPAVPVKRSVFSDHLVCLEDGKKLKMLKRHLMTTYHLTPEQYRQKWGLPANYPMVAPDYAARRSVLAKSIGLGRKPGQAPEPEAEAEPEAAPAPIETPEPAPRRRGRPPRQAAA